jgi:hypothetical protein
MTIPLLEHCHPLLGIHLIHQVVKEETEDAIPSATMISKERPRLLSSISPTAHNFNKLSLLSLGVTGASKATSTRRFDPTLPKVKQSSSNPSYARKQRDVT